MDRTVGGGVGVWGDLGWGGGAWGGAGALSFSTPFRLHDHIRKLVTSIKMLRCCGIHLLAHFCGNVLFTTC